MGSFGVLNFERTPIAGVIGLGQIGMSLSFDLISRGIEVFGFDKNPPALDFALQHGVKVVEKVEEIFDVADLIFYAIPAGQMKSAIAHISGVSFDRRVIIADLCSTKLDVEKVFTEASLDRSKLSYVGLHPLAGSEKRSYYGAVKGLFEGRVMVVAVGASTDLIDAISLAKLLIDTAKCRIVFANPATHDRLINFTIQIPHVFAYVASSFAKEVKDQVALEMFTGNSLRDVIRVARSDPAMVASFLFSNREILKSTLRSATARIESMMTILESGDESQLVALLDDYAPAQSRISYEATTRRSEASLQAISTLIDDLISAPYMVDDIEIAPNGDLMLSLLHLSDEVS